MSVHLKVGCLQVANCNDFKPSVPAGTLVDEPMSILPQICDITEECMYMKYSRSYVTRGVVFTCADAIQ
jgi:hypothetical protein